MSQVVNFRVSVNLINTTLSIILLKAITKTSQPMQKHHPQ